MDGGATATYYEVVFAVGQGGKQSSIARTGRYQDTLTKTTAGWQIQIPQERHNRAVS